RADSMNAECGEQADHTARSAQGDLGERAMLTGRPAGERIDAMAGALELAGACQTGQHDGGHSKRDDVARVQQAALSRELEHRLLVSGWGFAFHGEEYVADSHQ